MIWFALCVACAAWVGYMAQYQVETKQAGKAFVSGVVLGMNFVAAFIILILNWPK